MHHVKAFFTRPFGSAALGGLVVGLFGWIAISAGWIEASPAEGAGERSEFASTPVAAAAGGLSVNDIYQRTSPGVAHIEASGVNLPAGAGPFGPPDPSQAATGSGFVIDEEGHVVTNAHVVDGADDIEVRLGESAESYEAELLGQDDSTDVAVLRIDAGEDQLEPLALGRSSGLEVGDEVVAIGNPYGLDSTATAGIVSALQREISAPNGFTINNVIQTDAAINPGNSGGPLIDGEGEVVGVNSQIESPGGGNVGIGFAVPIDTTREIAQQLIEDGSVEHAFLGLTGADLTPALARAINLDAERGALVQSLVPDSPADEAGITAGDAVINLDGQRVRVGGDLILAIDGEAVKDMSEIIARVDSRKPGETIELTLLRAGDERRVEVELGERPATVRG